MQIYMLWFKPSQWKLLWEDIVADFFFGLLSSKVYADRKAPLTPSLMRVPILWIWFFVLCTFEHFFFSVLWHHYVCFLEVQICLVSFTKQKQLLLGNYYMPYLSNNILWGKKTLVTKWLLDVSPGPNWFGHYSLKMISLKVFFIYNEETISEGTPPFELVV